MRSQRILVVLSIALPVALLGLHCGSDTSPGPPPVSQPSAADSVAAHWMQVLSDSLAALPGPEDVDIQYYDGLRYDNVRAGFQNALNLDQGSRIGHLGMALMDLIELNYNRSIWDMVDSLDVYSNSKSHGAGLLEGSRDSQTKRGPGLFLDRRSPILGNQFTLLATAPRQLALMTVASFPANISVARAQQVVADFVIPALNSAIAHLDQVEDGGGPTFSIRDDEDETIEIDQGEVLLFDAALHAARAGFLIATAYDFDLFGPDHTYRWIDQIRSMDFCENFGIVQPYSGDPNYRSLTYVWKELGGAYRDSTIISMLRYNLEQRPSFLALKNTNLSRAYTDLQAMRQKLEASVAAIRSEGDAQEDDVLKIADLVEIDDDIRTDGDKPAFAENFTTVEDVLSWAEEVINGDYYLRDTNDQGQEYGMTIRLKALFLAPPENWATFLPYYRFLPASQWISWNEYRWSHSTSPTSSWSYNTCDGRNVQVTGIKEVAYLDYSYDVEFVDLLDGPNGRRIDLEDAIIPYFRDYTFGNIFPTATRQTWLTVFDTAGWDNFKRK